MTCIVSAYFKIPSKQSHEWYMPKVLAFLRHVNGEVVFFTEKDVFDELIFNYPTLLTKKNIKIVLLDFKNLNAITSLGMDFWQRQYTRDPERYHSPELGAIWYEKKEFVINAMALSTAHTFIWCDAGCIRDISHCKNLENFGTRLTITDNKIHITQMRVITRKNIYSFPDISVACGIMAGNRIAWDQYRLAYDNVLKRYDNSGACCISDQYITMSCMDERPDLFYPHTTKLGDEWLQLLEIL